MWNALIFFKILKGRGKFFDFLRFNSVIIKKPSNITSLKFLWFWSLHSIHPDIFLLKFPYYLIFILRSQPTHWNQVKFFFFHLKHEIIFLFMILRFSISIEWISANNFFLLFYYCIYLSVHEMEFTDCINYIKPKENIVWVCFLVISLRVCNWVSPPRKKPFENI